MPNTNLDVLHLVAEFLEPCPVLYTRLAMVNKDFFRVFTSDKLWAALDAYEKRTNIFPHFVEHTRDIRGFIKLYWCFNYYEWDVFVPDDYCDNLYLYLGYISNGRLRQEDLTAPENMVKLAVCLEPKMFPLFAPECRKSYELNLLACQKLPENYAYVSEELFTDKDFYAECLKAHQNHLLPMLFLTTQAEQRTSRAWALDMLWEINPSKYVEVRSFEGVTNETQIMEDDPPDIPELWPRISEKITDKNTALIALKGNGHLLHRFPEYAKDIDIIMAALDTYKWNRRGIPFLENNQNHNLVAKVLDNFPHLLYAAPQGFKEDKQRLIRFLESTSFTHGPFNLPSPYPPLTLIIWDITESTWEDPTVAGKITDAIFTNETYSDIPPENLRSKLPPVLCDDPEWIKERISQAPRAWCLASDRLKHDKDLVLHAIESIKTFANAPREIRGRNDTLGARLPHCFDSDYELLEQLFSVAGKDCKLSFLKFQTVISIEIINALVAPIPGREHAPGSVAPDSDYYEIADISRVFWKRSKKKKFIQYLQHHSDELKRVWLHPYTRGVAIARLGPPPLDLYHNLSDDEMNLDFPYSRRRSAPPDSDTRGMDVVKAVKLVCKNPQNFKDLTPMLQLNRNVLFAIERSEFEPDIRHTACRPQCALGWP